MVQRNTDNFAKLEPSYGRYPLDEMDKYTIDLIGEVASYRYDKEAIKNTLGIFLSTLLYSCALVILLIIRYQQSLSVGADGWMG